MRHSTSAARKCRIIDLSIVEGSSACAGRTNASQWPDAAGLLRHRVARGAAAVVLGSVDDRLCSAGKWLLRISKFEPAFEISDIHFVNIAHPLMGATIGKRIAVGVNNGVF